MKRVKLFFINTMLLLGTSLIMRTIGVSFNVYISNKIGASGMGLLSLVMSVYSLSITFATSGINLTASRLTAEAIGHGSDAEIKSAMKRCIIYSLSFGTLAGVVLYFTANSIGTYLLDDVRTVSSLKFLAYSLPFIALSSALHGYFTAVRRVYKNASAHLFEQLVKISLTSAGFVLIAPNGLEYACLAVVAGSCLAEVASFTYMLILYLYDINKHNANTGVIPDKLTRKLLNISLPVAFSAYIRSGLLTLEHLLIPFGLKRSGTSSEKSLASYGVLHGMVMPIVLFPQAVIGSFSGLLVPELAECKTRGDYRKINYIISRVFQITLCFSIGAAGIIMCYSYELGHVLYSNSEASMYIKLLAPLIPVMYLDGAVDSMLKGLNEQLFSMRVNIVDSLISVGLVYFLLPVLGIKGYILIIFICELINASMSISRLISVAEFNIQLVNWVLKPLFCIIGATSCTHLLFMVCGIMFRHNAVELIVHIVLTAAIYLVFLRVTFSVNRDDIKWIKSIVKG
jgi:Membrane protein involved in the export of O-antigen and teichoic acid